MNKPELSDWGRRMMDLYGLSREEIIEVQDELNNQECVATQKVINDEPKVLVTFKRRA